MTNYIIKAGDKWEHYFFRPYEGICKKERLFGGSWKEHTPVLLDARDCFSVYADRNSNVHIVCIDNENRLIYAVRKDGKLKKYVLSSLNTDIFVSEMRLYNVGGRLNLLYSALYNGENMLIHCILGNHAKPSCIDTLETSHFFIYESKVYYTNAKGELGYTSLSDEKPCGFNLLYPDAHHPTITKFAGREFLIFTREGRLFVNGEEILCDSRMEMPTCIKSQNKLYVMWKSGNFARYITTFNGGITWSEPMRFMNSGMAISSYLAQDSETFNLYYGYNTEKELTLLGAPDLLSGVSANCHTDIEKLKAMLDMARQEVVNAKKEISRLNKTIEMLKNTK